MNRGLVLGRVRGIPIVLDWSWGLVALLVLWAFYAELWTSAGDEPALLLWAAAVVGAAAFFGSVLAHELSHSLVAVRRGLRVRRIRLFVFGGVSEIEREATTPQDELAITLAGPVSSFGLGGVFALAALAVPGEWTVVERVAQVLAVVNGVLGVFNLLPGFPLDGGRVLRALVWRATGDYDRATGVAVAGGRLIAVVIAVGGILATRNLLGLWYVGIGLFLFLAAGDARAQARARRRMEGVTAGQIMRSVPRLVPAGATLQAFHEDYLAGNRGKVFPVLEGGRVRGLAGARELRRVRRSLWAQVAVGEVMRSLEPGDVADEATPIADVVERLAVPGRRILVVRDDRVAGIVAPRDVERLVDPDGLAGARASI